MIMIKKNWAHTYKDVIHQFQWPGPRTLSLLKWETSTPFLWSRLCQVDGFRRASHNAPFAYSWMHRFITLYKHGTVPEKETCQCVRIVCMQITLICCSSTHGQFSEHWKTDFPSLTSSLSLLRRARGARQGDLFHSSPKHTHTFPDLASLCWLSSLWKQCTTRTWQYSTDATDINMHTSECFSES